MKLKLLLTLIINLLLNIRVSTAMDSMLQDDDLIFDIEDIEIPQEKKTESFQKAQTLVSSSSSSTPEPLLLAIAYHSSSTLSLKIPHSTTSSSSETFRTLSTKPEITSSTLKKVSTTTASSSLESSYDFVNQIFQTKMKSVLFPPSLVKKFKKKYDKKASKDLNNTIIFLDKETTSDPQNSINHLQLGNFFIKRFLKDIFFSSRKILDSANDYTSAIQEYKKAIKLDPNLKAKIIKKILKNGFLTLDKFKKNIQYKNSEERFTLLVDLRAASTFFYIVSKIDETNKIAQEKILFTQEFFNKLLDHNEEEKQYQQAIQLDPKNALAHFSLGMLYHQYQSFAAAKKELRIAESLNLDKDSEEIARQTIEEIDQKL